MNEQYYERCPLNSSTLVSIGFWNYLDSYDSVIHHRNSFPFYFLINNGIVLKKKPGTLGVYMKNRTSKT